MEEGGEGRGIPGLCWYKFMLFSGMLMFLFGVQMSVNFSLRFMEKEGD
jgi:hypothetical protein